jgi:hypothetical protein
LPKVLFAGSVGTIKHNTMAYDENIAEQRHWLYCGGWTRAIVKATKNMMHTQKHTSCKLQVFTRASLMMLTKILENGNVNMMSLCPKEER